MSVIGLPELLVLGGIIVVPLLAYLLFRGSAPKTGEYKPAACTRCHHVGEPLYRQRGSGWITFLLLFLYVIPALVYDVWRRSGPVLHCAACDSTEIVPVDTPRGREIAEGLAAR